MGKKNFVVKTRKVIFSKGPIHLVDCQVTMSNGRILSRQILEHPGAVVIIPEISKGQFLLVRQFRFAARAWLWEWPAGGMEANETPKKTAIRELMEETGYRPRKLKKILEFFPTPGISSEKMYLYLGQNLIPQKAQGDEDEEIETASFSLSTIQRMAKKGLICDAKTLLGIDYLKNKFAACSK